MHYRTHLLNFLATFSKPRKFRRSRIRYLLAIVGAVRFSLKNKFKKVENGRKFLISMFIIYLYLLNIYSFSLCIK